MLTLDSTHHIPAPIFVVRDAESSLVFLQWRLNQDDVKLALKVT